MSSDKPTQPAAQFNQSGSKYLRPITHLLNNGCADVYAVLIAFAVTCPARQHAIKKLLCSGIRGKGDTLQDLREARDAIDRAIQIEGGSIIVSPPLDIRVCVEGKAGPFDRDDMVIVVRQVGTALEVQSSPTSGLFAVLADRFEKASPEQIERFRKQHGI